MPKYLNTTGTQYVLSGVVLPLRYETTTETFIREALPSGVSKTSDAPYYNMLFLDNIYTSDTDISLDGINTSSITIEVKSISGDVRLFLSSTDNTPGFLVLSGKEREIQINPMLASKLVLQFVAPSGSDKVQICINKR